tara:strand:- start:40 stop:267 length:228 start_codon:yes stop_codon:yes gene_type:complete
MNNQVDYKSFTETLMDEYNHTFFECARCDEDGNVDPFIRFTIMTLFEYGIKDTEEMMKIIEPMLYERKDHLEKLI